MNKPAWLSKKREESKDIIQPNREAQAPADGYVEKGPNVHMSPNVHVGPGVFVGGNPVPQTKIKDQIGRIAITRRDRRDGDEFLASCAGFQPEDDGFEPIRRTFRIDNQLNAFLETNCDGNLNGYVQGLLVYAIEELINRNQTLHVAFVNDDGTPAKRKRTTKNKKIADGSAATSSPSGPDNSNGGEE